MIKEITQCRICGNKNLIPVLDLGQQSLTGVFPKSTKEKITMGPLALVRCDSESKASACGLLQLKHSYSLSEMYGENYGYRSGLNRSMVAHLQGRVKKLQEFCQLKAGDLVIDIGSNDSTTLQTYSKDLLLVGIDPTGIKFKSYYPSHIKLIPDFFSARVVKDTFGSKKAKVITSIAMFYDLEDPISFMRQIQEVLSDDGIWVFEQSYMPTMLAKNSYDTICHEHLEYYALAQIKWMTDNVGFKIVDVEFNAANGGSFAITVTKKSNEQLKENIELIEKILKQEKDLGLSTTKTYDLFNEHIVKQKDALIKFVRDINQSGKKIFGYGASTKGNVILQWCGFSAKDIPMIADVNKDKWGCVTPGTGIPIVSEADAKGQNPDYFLVLPWHFKENIIEREKDFLQQGGMLVMPLPSIEIINQKALQPK